MRTEGGNQDGGRSGEKGAKPKVLAIEVGSCLLSVQRSKKKARARTRRATQREREREGKKKRVGEERRERRERKERKGSTKREKRKKGASSGSCVRSSVFGFYTRDKMAGSRIITGKFNNPLPRETNTKHSNSNLTPSPALLPTGNPVVEVEVRPVKGEAEAFKWVSFVLVWWLHSTLPESVPPRE